MSENSIAQKLDTITRSGDRASKSFTSLQANMIKAESAIQQSGSKVNGVLSNISQVVQEVGTNSGILSGGMGSLGVSFSSLANPIGLAVAALTAFAVLSVQAVQKAAPLQQSVADLSAITGIAGDDLQSLSDKSIEFSKDSGIAAVDITEAYKLLASNIDVMSMGGVGALESLTQSTITLSQAAGTTLPEAADTMSFAINQFKLSANDANRVINTLAAGAKFGAAEIPDLAASLKVAGVTASGAGIQIEQTVAAIETLSKVGIKGAEAGTGLRNILLKLQTENIPGVNLKADGLTESLKKLAPKMNDAAYLTKIFGMENVNAAQALIGNVALLDDLESKVTGTSVAQEQAAIRTSTYKASVDRMRASWDAVLISLGEKLLPIFTKVADKITQFINWLNDDGNPVIKYFSSIIELASVPLKVIWTLLSDTTEALGRMFDVFDGGNGKISSFFSGAVTIFSAFADLIAGTFTNVATLVNPVNWINPSKMKEAASNLGDVYKGFGSSFMDVVKGKTKQSESSQQSLSASQNIGGQTTSTNTSGSSGSGGSIDAGVNAITSGGKSVRNVEVNIGKLVEAINVYASNVKESASDIQKIVEEALIRAINGSEIAISNN